MKNRKHSKIDLFYPSVRKTVDKMIKSSVYCYNIIDYIKYCVASITVTAVEKYAKNLMRQENCRISDNGLMITVLYKRVGKFIKENLS